MLSFTRWTKIVLAWLAFVVLSPLLGAAAFFGSAKLTSSVVVLVLGALLACFGAAYGMARLGIRVTKRASRPGWALAVAGAMVALFGGAGGVALFARPSLPAPSPMGERLVPFEKVRLPTGSTLAIARIPADARDPSVQSPLVYLHGGPGAYVRDSDLELLRSIAAQGIDVVAYDQAGGGLSDRLEVREYSVARAVADLDAVREHLGVERLSLLGQSWGAMLAQEYAYAHPDRVDKLALTSGGLITSSTKGFAVERTASGAQPKFPPYFYAASFLFRINPDAALAFLPRADLDATWRRGAAANIGRWYCKEDAASVPPVEALLSAPLFDGYQTFALKAEMGARVEPPAPPAKLPPSLMIRGACDYVPWEAARLLRDNLGAKLVTIEGVGHALWPKKADLVRDLVVAHLKGHPLPGPVHTGAEDPAVASR